MEVARADPGQGRGGGGGVRDDEGAGREAAGGDRRAGVEAEPAEPQEARAEDGHRDVVRLDLLGAGDALADQQGDDQGGQAGEAWTTVPPAKSRAPSLNSQPSVAQTQCAIGE